MLVVYSNYFPGDPSLASFQFTAPDDGNLLVTCAYSLRSSGTKELPQPATVYDQLSAQAKQFFDDLGLKQAKKEFEGKPQTEISFAKITCTVNGEVVSPGPGDKMEDKGFSDTFLKWEKNIPMRAGEKVRIGVFRQNERADPVRNPAYNTDQHGFLLIGQFS